MTASGENGKPGNHAQRLVETACDSDQDILPKRPCMVAIIALENLQIHKCVIMVLAKVINFSYSSFTNLFLISVNCMWSGWTPWNDCSASCGGGTQLRYRTVEQTAENGGQMCEGEPSESQACGTNACPTGMESVSN